MTCSQVTSMIGSMRSKQKLLQKVKKDRENLEAELENQKKISSSLLAKQKEMEERQNQDEDQDGGEDDQSQKSEKEEQHDGEDVLNT